MSDTAPWLSIIGLGEDGLAGLAPASLAALEAAEIVMGPPRHLALLPTLAAQTIAWPVPFADGVTHLLGLRGRRVAVLASGDPFWFGAGSVLARHLSAGEWRAFPGVSSFSMVAARLGWALDDVGCFGLHAAPFARLRPHLAPGARMIVLLRDGAAVAALADYLGAEGFAATGMDIFEALGGPRERHVATRADALADTAFAHPVCAALCIAGEGASVPHASGLDDAWFAHDGQITKRPIRALTLSTLAPRAGEHLWDIGAGSGSVAIEWLLAQAGTRATAFEVNADRAARIRENAARFGVEARLTVVEGHAPDCLDKASAPQAVFVGGGLSAALLGRLTGGLGPGTRLVANAVTLETEALLTAAQAQRGGDLLRIALSQAAPLGAKRGWKSAYPIVQWSVVL